MCTKGKDENRKSSRTEKGPIKVKVINEYLEVRVHGRAREIRREELGTGKG